MDSELKILSTALKDYQKQNKSVWDFEEDYGCRIICSHYGGIKGIEFKNEGAKSAFYLRYYGK